MAKIKSEVFSLAKIDFPLEKIVFSYKEFGYNKCNVCMTPHTPVNWSNHYISQSRRTKDGTRL